MKLKGTTVGIILMVGGVLATTIVPLTGSALIGVGAALTGCCWVAGRR